MTTVAEQVLSALRTRKSIISTAESCTGGMVAAALTDVAGSSDIFDRGFVTYSNVSKIEMLGVNAEMINRHGAVSEEVARAMAEGAIVSSRAGVAIAVTGIAGPCGGSSEKPVGLVHFGLALRNGSTSHAVQVFSERTRAEIRYAARDYALMMVLAELNSWSGISL